MLNYLARLDVLVNDDDDDDGRCQRGFDKRDCKVTTSILVFQYMLMLDLVFLSHNVFDLLFSRIHFIPQVATYYYILNVCYLWHLCYLMLSSHTTRHLLFFAPEMVIFHILHSTEEAKHLLNM